MTIVEATKLRIEELCNERGLNFCRLATISGVPYTTVKSIVYNQKGRGIFEIFLENPPVPFGYFILLSIQD